MRKRMLGGLVAMAVLLSACSSHSAPEVSTDSRFDAAAIMFAQMMIPHHEQALEMSELALTNSTNADILELAAEIKAAQAPEIDQMRAWLAEAGAAEGGDHAGHMDGMLSDEQLAALAAATGAEFDRLFLEGMIEHHRGAIAMAEDVLSNPDPEVRALAEAVVAAQTAEIAAMESWLAALTG